MSVAEEILKVEDILKEFELAGGKMPYEASTYQLAEGLVGLYFDADDVHIGIHPVTGNPMVVVFVQDGLHCTEDPDPDYELAYALGQTETVSGLSPRNAGLKDDGSARTTVRGDALQELSLCIQFLLRSELRGWVDLKTREQIVF